MRLGRPKPHRDPVTPEMAAYIDARDGPCAAPLLLETGLMPGICQGWTEKDHIHTGGFGYRGPSTKWNLVNLCRRHHRLKTENGQAWRQALDWYIAQVEAAR